MIPPAATATMASAVAVTVTPDRPAPTVCDPPPAKKLKRAPVNVPAPEVKSAPAAPFSKETSSSPLQRLLAVPPGEVHPGVALPSVGGAGKPKEDDDVKDDVEPEVVDLTGDDDIPDRVARRVNGDAYAYHQFLASFRVAGRKPKKATAAQKKRDSETMTLLSKKLYKIGDKLNDVVVTVAELIEDEELIADTHLWESLRALSETVYESATELELEFKK